MLGGVRCNDDLPQVSGGFCRMDDQHPRRSLPLGDWVEGARLDWTVFAAALAFADSATKIPRRGIVATMPSPSPAERPSQAAHG